MSVVSKLMLTYQEYLVRKKVAPGKSEFYRGQIFAMAGVPSGTTPSAGIYSRGSVGLFAARHVDL